MKKNKSEVVKHRLQLLTITALALGILAIWTGFFGFVYRPAANAPNAATPPTEAIQAAPTEPPTVAPMQTEPVPPMTEGTPGLPDAASEEVMTAPEETQDLSNVLQGEENAPPVDTAEGAPDPQVELAEETTAPVHPAAEDVPDPTADTAENSYDATMGTAENAPAPTADRTSDRIDPPALTPEEAENHESDHGLKSGFRLFMRIVFCICLMAEAVNILLLLILRKNIREHQEKTVKTMDAYRPTKVAPVPITRKDVEQPLHPIPGISLGKVHDMGNREYQQDSFGQIAVLKDTGILVVLADGMGGLSGGERVSQRIVMEALNYGAAIQASQLPNALPDMVASINRAVNQMLGPDGLYASGSTVVSALIVENALWWISVGDSRIYLYRDQQLNQLSRDHDLLQDWMGEILEGKRSMAEAVKDPDGRKLTSFIGMGELRYVDSNRDAIPLLPGDRVLLMSDGIYGTVSDDELEAILQSTANVQEAASRIAQRITEAALPYQDNYTLVILGYDPPRPFPKTSYR